MELYFVLVEPATAGNIGASARAMNTMGFSKMRLVNPCDHLCDEARWMAHGSNEILESAELFPTLADALHGMDLVIGTTARHRKSRYQYVECHDLRELILAKRDNVAKAAIVFGREMNGLSNEELMLCDILTTVATAKTYPALNLSQAVMIYAYQLALGRKLQTEDRRFGVKQADQGEYQVLKQGISKIMDLIGIEREHKLHQRLLGRLSHLGHDDLQMAHFVKKKLAEKLGLDAE
jgi:tRNA/rRNA methyltransferase